MNYILRITYILAVNSINPVCSVNPVNSIKITKPNLCIDCKHYTKPFIFADKNFGKCSLFPRPDLDEYFFVVGSKSIDDYYPCCIARAYDDMCGKDGKLFEKKTK
jgi:hypothetical protein